MKVVIAGESPFLEEVGQLCLDAGLDTALYLVEGFLSAVQSGWAMDEAARADVAIELLHESQAAKEELLSALGGFLRPDALMLTSALTTGVTETAAWLPNPERVVGFGLLPPLERQGMVELARGLLTGETAVAQAQQFWRKLGQEPVWVKDGAGLVRARTVCCLINEAVSALQEGVATAADIDKAMQLGTNYPRGVLAWADHLGLDMVLGVMRGLQAEWGEDRYRPAPLLKRMVAAGRLGKKSGQGFFNYEA